MSSGDHTFSEFYFPPGATAPIAARVNRALFASDARWSLGPYCFVIDTLVRDAPEPRRNLLQTGRAYVKSTARWWPRRRSVDRPSWRGDVIVAGECAGRAELEVIARLIDGVATTGRSVLYLSTRREETGFVRQACENSQRRGRVTVLELPDLSRAGEFWARSEAHAQFAEDLWLLEPILRGAGAWLWRDALPQVRQVALAKTVWRSMRENIDASALITLTNYRPLSAVLLAEAAESRRLSISFQHSVVTCPGSFVPIPCARYAVFGAASRGLLDRLDAEFAAAVGRQPVCRDIVSIGSLLDPIAPREAAAASGDILVIDSGEGFARNFFGIAEEFSALESAAGVLSKMCAPRRSLVVRAHPRGGAGRWRRVARRFGGRIKVSTGRPLAEDLRSAALVVGLFSTVLPVAAACGLPVFFLWKPGWFFTPDLAAFAPDHFADPDALPARAFELLKSESLYRRASRSAQAAAEQYFAGVRQCEFDRFTIDSLLAPLP
jgi:hypothetical protein